MNVLKTFFVFFFFGIDFIDLKYLLCVLVLIAKKKNEGSERENRFPKSVSLLQLEQPSAGYIS